MVSAATISTSGKFGSMTPDNHQRRQPFAFGTKAETLERIAPLVALSSVPEFIYFTVAQWQSGREEILRRIGLVFVGAPVIVRSSARMEDGGATALAGLFESVPNVEPGDPVGLGDAIERVMSSYREHNTVEDLDDQIIVQKMVVNVLMSGVLFTRDLNTGAPYYAINYDDETGRTDTVTSGGEYSNRTLYVHKNARDAVRSPRFLALVSAVIEIEHLIDEDALDIEFAVDENHLVHLFQVRRITSHANWNPSVTGDVDNAIADIQASIRGQFAPKSGIFGGRSVFGQMPDWNPAEIIGRIPRALALSLYRYLITDRVWREARRNMGYHEPANEALLVSLGGQPYVDTRLSFHSFLPNTLSASTCHKLVDAWLDRLVANPQLHDKVEFDVAITSFAFDFDNRAANQFPNVLDAGELAEFRSATRHHTGALIRGEVAPIHQELKRIEQLADHLSQTKLGDGTPDLRQQLDNCIELGTRPFSVLARHGFIAQSLLRSLVALGVITETEVSAFMRSVQTVAGEFTADNRRLARGELDRDRFFERYGHLRPGTYDILSARYDQRHDFLADVAPSESSVSVVDYAMSPEQLRALDELVDREKLGVSPQELISYIREATAGREYAKFVFTRGLSDALEVIADWGSKVGLSRDELSHIEIDVLLRETEAEWNDGRKKALMDLSADGGIKHRTTQALRLPQLLFDEEGVHVIPFQLCEPNFITHKVVRGHCIKLGRHDGGLESMKGAVVLIENADPGFDWIFAHRIGGLVTKFGGTNSHMAIRCAEFGIPAAIGCGEQIFERVGTAKSVEINCAEGHIRPIDEDLSAR